jgi:hypothetical protein
MVHPDMKDLSEIGSFPRRNPVSQLRIAALATIAPLYLAGKGLTFLDRSNDQ